MDATSRAVQKGWLRMIVALWIIAVCEVIRVIHNIGTRDNAYAEFISESLKRAERESIRRMLEEFESEV